MRKLVSVLLGLFLLAWGLSMLGVPGFAQAGDFVAWLARLWPLLLVALGVHGVAQGWRNPRGLGLVWGATVLALGVVWLGNNLRLWPPVSLFAALLIGAGAGMVVRALRR